MTQTTTTAQPLTIPPQGLRAELGNVVITAFYVNGAGYKVMARRAGQLIASTLHTFDIHALQAYNALVAEHTPAPTEPAPAPRLAVVAKGTATKVSDPQHIALAVAEISGRIERGGQPGQASVTVLKALAKRGYLTLTYSPTSRFTVTGGTITGAGRTRLNQLTATDAETADYAARLAAALTINIAA